MSAYVLFSPIRLNFFELRSKLVQLNLQENMFPVFAYILATYNRGFCKSMTTKCTAASIITSPTWHTGILVKGVRALNFIEIGKMFNFVSCSCLILIPYYLSAHPGLTVNLDRKTQKQVYYSRGMFYK